MGAAVAAPSRPGEAGAASAPTAVALGGAAVVALGLALTQLGGREDAVAENYTDTESCMFSEVGDSHASSHTVNSEAEGAAAESAAAADSKQDRPRVQRQTPPVYRTDLTEGRLKFWKGPNGIQGVFTGNIGFMFGSGGKHASNKL